MLLIEEPAQGSASGPAEARGDSIPASIFGLNARDALADMDPRYAVMLDNLFPEATYISVRKGYTSHATGMSGTIETLMEWSGPSSNKLKAANAGNIYDVTTAGAVGAAEVTGLSENDWQHVQFSTSGGNFLVCCNGTDAVRNYDGTSWTSPSITGSGLTSSNLINVVAFKNRLWFIEKNKQDPWYLPTNAISGAATKYTLGSQFKLGGKLQGIGTVSRDAGDGADDKIAFISSKGEVLVYEGSDPASANTFGISGRYRIGAPIGNRCVIDVAGDLGIICDDGVVSLNQMMGLDRASAARAAITDNIQTLFNRAVVNYKSNFGWQGQVYPRGTRALFNIPVSTTEFHQYTMNTITGAWCRFKGMNGACWGLMGDDLYFGGTDGKVYKADVQYQDNGGTITADLQTAWNPFKNKGRNKFFQAARPMYQTTGIPSILFDVNVDFSNADPSGSISVTAPSNSLWGTATWHNGTTGGVWAGEGNVSTDWISPGSIGEYGSARMRITVNGQSFILNSISVIVEDGGPI